MKGIILAGGSGTRFIQLPMEPQSNYCLFMISQ